jgi:hypothetical protein
MNQTVAPINIKPLTPQHSLTQVCDLGLPGDSLHKLIQNGYTQ